MSYKSMQGVLQSEYWKLRYRRRKSKDVETVKGIANLDANCLVKVLQLLAGFEVNFIAKFGREKIICATSI